MANRALAENYLYKMLDELTFTKFNSENYRGLFSKMTDKEFDKFVTKLVENKQTLPVTIANFECKKMTIESNIAFAKKQFNYDFFKRIWIGPTATAARYLTPIKHMVLTLPVRRASQRLDYKLSVPTSNKATDTTTGQATGVSKGSGFSYPEMQVLNGMNMFSCITELMKYRGGDTGGFAAMNLMLARYGTANQTELAKFSTGVESTKSLKIYLAGMMLKSTL